MIDFSQVKLGKAPYVHDPRNFHLSTYLPEIPKVPDAWNWGAAVPADKWDMDGNDNAGCCPYAGMDHQQKMWIYNHGGKYVSTAQQVLQVYSDATGYDPNRPSTDNGDSLSHALKYWQKTGFLGYQIGPYVKVDATNLARVRAALYLFGGLYSGVGLPLTAQDQKVWTVTNPMGSSGRPYSWGGHCVVLTAYRPGFFSCSTWGMIQDMDEEFLGTYFDELWAILSLDWFTKDHRTPTGFKYSQLMKDLKSLQS